jgi:tetratricopeptide (TPR) repeat protein
MSYWGIELTEAEAASFLKPNPEDPNVRPDEIAAYAETLGYHVLVRVNGDFETLKRLLLAGYPVVIETGYDPEPTTVGWTSHYLTLAGFSEDGFIAMDTYRRPNWFYPYQEIDTYWRQFNRRYLVAYRDDQAVAIASIIGENMDDEIMYTSALNVASAELSLDRSDAFGWFNVGSNLVALERFEEAASAFDEARRLGLPGRFLWYQFTPFEAYMAVGRYEDVITIADAVLEKKANEEAFYYKGLALAAMGDADRARVQLSLALRANPSFQPAQDALDELEG